MLPVKNVRYIVFTCCVVLATVHIVYLWTLLHKLPSNTARYSLGGLARRAFHTNERLETSLPATQHLPEATLVCRDIQPPTGQCKNALQQGLCYGDVLTHCISTCGQCGMLKSVAREAINVRIKEADELECQDESEDCKEFVVRDKCDTQPLVGIAKCKASCGFCQQEHPPGDLCQDRLDLCPYLATNKQLCGSPDDSVWMQALCRASCGGCATSQGVSSSKLHELSRLRRLAGDGECADFHTECPLWAKDHRCTYNRAFMQAHCRLSCNLCGSAQVVYGASKADWKVGLDAAGRWVIATSQTSLGQTTGGVKGSLAGECKDQFPSCSDWAMQGECKKNPGYMLKSCRLSCNMCQTPSDYGNPVSSGAGTSEQVPMVPFTYFADVMQQVQLNNGVLMPTIGLGTAGLGEGTQQAVASALSVGYRHIDSAQAREWYREDLVGKGLGNYLLVPRADLFITTKIHPRHLGFEETLAAFSQSMVDLNTDYVDLLLLHYPSCWGDLCKALPGTADPPARASTGPRTYKDTWRAFEQLYLANKARAIGVSNFNPQELQELYKVAKIKPQVLQAHMDPFAQNRDLQSMCKADGTQMVAYSSLGTQWHTKGGNPVLNHPTLQAIAKAVNRTVAQVVLRWVLHMGVLAIPRSSNTEHMKESLEILDFSLNEAQIAQIMMLEGFVKND